MANAKDYTGMKFNMLTALRRNDVDGVIRWDCQCECGQIINARMSNIVTGSTMSCGCWRVKNVGDRQRTHGESRTPDYYVWSGIKKRCLNPDAHNYAQYGGKGIDVSDEWKDSFETFKNDMGPRPSPQHSVERRNNKKGYSADNCYWATPVEQANNRSTNTIVEHEGEKMTVAQLARKLDRPYEQVLREVNRKKK